MNANKTEYLCFKQGDISTFKWQATKISRQFTYLSSNISSTESDVNMHLVKAWTAIDRLLIILKSYLSDKIKWDFFPICGCVSTTVWMLTKHMEKKVDRN